MKIAITSPGYPSQTSNSFAFVHTRVRLYQKRNHEVKVFNIGHSEQDYTHENMPVAITPKSHFCEKVNGFKPDVIAVYYPTYWLLPLLRKLPFPKVAWILGHEMLWSLRLMGAKNPLDWIKKRIVLIPRLAYQIYAISRWLQELDHTIFVSQWLRDVAQRHALARFDNAVVIPNPVDTTLFQYETPARIERGISVRSMERSIYGLDIAIKAFANMDGADLTICGSGRLHRSFARLIKKSNSRTTMNVGTIAHRDLPALYHRHGFFVAPSRGETQGVAMCEAMACGLPVVATKVGAIPEFVRDGIDGILVAPNDPAALRDGVQQLLSDRDRYFEMSRNARANIETLCDANVVAERELEVLQNAQARKV